MTRGMKIQPDVYVLPSTFKTQIPTPPGEKLVNGLIYGRVLPGDCERRVAANATHPQVGRQQDADPLRVLLQPAAWTDRLHSAYFAHGCAAAADKIKCWK